MFISIADFCGYGNREREIVIHRWVKWNQVPVSERMPPLCKGWCSAQRIKIPMIAGGNHTIICGKGGLCSKHRNDGTTRCGKVQCRYANSHWISRERTAFRPIPPPQCALLKHLPLHKGGMRRRKRQCDRFQFSFLPGIPFRTLFKRSLACESDFGISYKFRKMQK